MTRRYTSGFDILGFDTDPTPGDPDIILNQIVPKYTSIGDDSETALNSLKGSAVQSGSGKTMDALNKLIGTTYPPKLQKAADSFHSAASIYATYANALSEAQSQLDRAMDQATPVAALADTTVAPAPVNATPDQVSAVQQQQQSVDQANTQLTAAKRLGQDAKDIRDQAGNTFNTNLNEVSAVPGLSIWQKIEDFFEHNPIFQIFVDIAIAITSIFFPVVGLVLGAADFLFNSLVGGETGNFSLGSFLTGLLTLAVGGGLLKGIAALGKGAAGFFTTASGDAAKGLASDAEGLGSAGDAAGGGKSTLDTLKGLAKNPIVKGIGTTVGDFGVNAVGGVLGDVADHKPIDTAEVLGSAAVGAVVGGAFSGVRAGLGFSSKPDSSGPAAEPKPSDPATTPAGAAGSDSATEADPGTGTSTDAPPQLPSPSSTEPLSIPLSDGTIISAEPRPEPDVPHEPAPPADEPAPVNPVSAEPAPVSPAGVPHVSLPSPSAAPTELPHVAAPPAGEPAPVDPVSAEPAPVSPAGAPHVSLPTTAAPHEQPAPHAAAPAAAPHAEPSSNVQPSFADQHPKVGTGILQAGHISSGIAQAGSAIGIANAEGDQSKTPDQVEEGQAQSELPALAGGQGLNNAESEAESSIFNKIGEGFSAVTKKSD